MATKIVPVLNEFSWQNPVIFIQNTPPASPVKGDRYVVADTPTGAWVGYANNITIYNGSSWDFASPVRGMICYCTGVANQYLYFNNAYAWDFLAELPNITEAANLRHAASTQFNKTTAAEISALTDKATPIDGDNFLAENSANSNSKIKVLWSSIKATLKAATVYSRSFVLTNPTSTADGAIWRTPTAITITAIHVLCVDGTNIIGGLDECDANGLNPVAVDVDITGTAGTNVNDDGSLTNPGIDAGDYIYWHTTSVSGTVTKAIVTFDYVIV